MSGEPPVPVAYPTNPQGDAMIIQPTRRAALALPAALATPIAARPGLDPRWRDLARAIGALHPNGARAVAQAAALGAEIADLRAVMLVYPSSAEHPALLFWNDKTPGNILTVGPSGARD
jgi:hypothetical protein